MFTTVRRLAIGSIAIAFGVFALKVVAWQLTGSAALYSDAVESIVNVAAATAAFLAVRIADTPADEKHPFGHHKAEYISAVFEGVLIVLASIAVFRAAWDAFLAPQPIEAPVTGFAVNALASVINAAWGWFLVQRGRVWNSPALVADGRHLLADLISSVGVLGGLILAVLTQVYLLDAILAAFVGVFILWAGWRLLYDSVGGLMDEATSPETVAQISAIVADAAEGAIQIHDLRTRRAARAVFIEFHLVVDGEITVARAHEICDRIEAALAREIEGAVTTIHVEPEFKAKRRNIIEVG